MYLKHATCSLGLLLIVGCECFSAPPVTFGRIYSAALNSFGLFDSSESAGCSLIPSIKSEGSNSSVSITVADSIVCANEDETRNLTVWGVLNGPTISLSALQESFLLNTSTTGSIDVYFDDSGYASNCTAGLEDTFCSSCRVCETPNGTVGLSIECPSIPELDSSGYCMENQIIEEASQRTGSFATNLTFNETIKRMDDFFGTMCFTGEGSSSATVANYSVFYASREMECSQPLSDNFPSGTTRGSAQADTGTPTKLGTRTFQVCSDDGNACSMLFYDGDGGVISACSIFPNKTSHAACASCEVCTSENGGVGVSVECPTHPEFTTDGCRNFPVLNPTSSPTSSPDTSGSSVWKSLFLSVIVLLLNFGLRY